MKKRNLFIALVWLACVPASAQTWDILDKSMDAYNQDGGLPTNGAWQVNQGGNAGGVATQEDGYVNFTKTKAGGSGSGCWAWVRPADALSEPVAGTSYSIEVKARVHSVGVPDDGSYIEANQMALRVGSKSIAAPIYLKYGDGVSGGSVSSVPGGADACALNTAEWQVYRWVFHADHARYDVYVEGMDGPVFEDVEVISTGDANGVYFGAESYHRCNMDVMYVKMGTGDFFSGSKIVSVNLSSDSQVEKTTRTIEVTVTTVRINDGETLLVSLVDDEDRTLVEAVETVVANDKAVAELTIPATVTKGNYYVKVAAPNDQLGETTVRPQTVGYFVCLPNRLADWMLGGFVRPEGKNPVIEPNPQSTFFCPMNQAEVKWEESDTFNPGAVVKDGKICVLYRAEDNSATGIGKRVSRVALAETTDGITMTRRLEPIFFPDEDPLSQEYEWPGGIEDPRVAVTTEGLFVMYYTAWDRDNARLCVASSRDLLTWTRHGPIFAKAYNGKYLNEWTKSSSIVTELKDDKLVVAEMNVEYDGKTWTYLMYWGENAVHAAVSDNLTDWTPVENGNGGLLALANTRRGYFDSSLVECGPPAVRTDKGVLLLYNGRNNTNAYADPRFNMGTYSAGQMLFDLEDPFKMIARSDVPFFRPMDSFEKSGQYVRGTVFIEGLVYFEKKWYLYYGCADSKVGVAIYDPANPADGDPVPDYQQGKGIAYYPAHGIGKKVARIHSSSGQTKDSESAFNLLYSYLGPRKWCEDKNANPWVIFEFYDYYNIDKTVFRDVAPYESGNGNVPEYWIYTSVTGTADSDWKEVVHKTGQQRVDVKEDMFDVPEEARYIKFVASRGIRTDNGQPENAIRIYGFDIYGSFSRPVDRGNVVSVGKTVLGFHNASEDYWQPLHLFDGDVVNEANQWRFARPSVTDSLRYVVIDLEEEYEVAKFVLYDAGTSGADSRNIDGYAIYVATEAPVIGSISGTGDRNTVWTKVVDATGRRSEQVKTDVIEPVAARYIKLEIPRSRTTGAVRLSEFEVHKKGDGSGVQSACADVPTMMPTTLESGESITICCNVESGKVSLYNLQGRLLQEVPVCGNGQQIPIQLPAGLYVARLECGTQRSTEKLLVN